MDDCTRVERVTFRKKEAAAVLLVADNMSVRTSPDGGLVMELFRYGKNDRAVESYRFHLAPDDRARIASIA